jgi:hypothetical protein
MAFMEEDNGDPTRADEGKFIPDSELREWWSGMQQKYPEIYKTEDKLFGTDGAQHKFGTKLMTYFDDDPNKPIRLIVRGSRWAEDPYSFSGSIQTPMYVVKYRKSTELSQIVLDSAHEEAGWRVGWDIDDGEEEDDVIPVQDMETSDDEVCGEECVALPEWNTNSNGLFTDAFLKSSFTPEEREILASGSTGLYQNLTQATKSASSINFEVRAIAMRILLEYSQHYKGGVIVKTERGTKFQAMEFIGPHEGPGSVPYLQITYAIDSASIDNAMFFLRDEEYTIIEISDRAGAALETHILKNCVNRNLNDVGSGLLYHEGFLSPFPIHKNESDPSTSCATKNLINDGYFGVELELSCAVGTDRATIAHTLQEHSGETVRNIRDPSPYRVFYAWLSGKGKSDTDNSANNGWKLVYDASIQANSNLPRSRGFELVSPILCGETGLARYKKILTVLSDITALQVNASMGCHVHIDVESLKLQQLIQVCQNFVAYEDDIDTFMPSWRRTGSAACNTYFKSNKESILVQGDEDHAWQQYQKIGACQTYEELYDIMNPGSEARYYKLNLQNLKTGRQPTIEFRQHPATRDCDDVLNWVRFCMALVHNSSDMPATPPSKTGQKGERDETSVSSFTTLFESIIQDPGLQEYYGKRRNA